MSLVWPVLKRNYDKRKKQIVSFFLQEKTLLDAMFDVPGSNVKGVLIDEEVVEGKKEAEYIRHEEEVVEDEFEGDEQMKSASY